MTRLITCINCPVGCRMTVEMSGNGAFISASGNACPRGERYAAQECTCPTRVITAVLPVVGTSVPLSVKTSLPVPKDRISEIMGILSKTVISPPVAIGDVLIADVLHTGADVVATRNIPL